jgi:hypothetical protein
MKNSFYIFLALAVSACNYNNNVLEIYDQKNTEAVLGGYWKLLMLGKVFY